MTKSRIYFVFLSLFVSGFAWAEGITKMNCQVYDSTESVVTETISIYATRGSKEFQIFNNKTLIIDLSWPYVGSSVTARLLRNPNYPWSLPFTVKTLSKGKLKSEQNGQISGTITLQSDSEVFFIQCTTSL